MNTHAQPIPTATFIGHLSIGERERLAFTNGDRCTAEMLAALDDLSRGDETPDDDKSASGAAKRRPGAVMRTARARQGRQTQLVAARRFSGQIRG